MTRTSTFAETTSEPTGLTLAVLEKAEEHRLHPQAHLADFVEEDRAFVGKLKQADLVAMGAGEAAPDMAEQL